MEKEIVIYTITSLYTAKPDLDNMTVIGQLEYRSSLVGFYRSLDKAKQCVEEDWADFDEAGYYNYVVIERNVEGLYNINGFELDIQTEWWYKFDDDNNKWVVCEKPDWSVGIVGWGLG